MPPTSLSPDETAAAAAVLSTGTKWLLGILGALFSAALSGSYMWMWATDRAVRDLNRTLIEREKAEACVRAETARLASLERDERQLWRRELLEWVRSLDERQRKSELENATQKGLETGRKERSSP